MATPEERKRLFQALFHKIYVHEGNTKAVEPSPVLWALLSTAVPEAGTTGFEPAISALTGQYVNRYTTSPVDGVNILATVGDVKAQICLSSALHGK